MGNSGSTNKVQSKNVSKTQASVKRAENMLAKPSKVQDLTKLQSQLEQDAATALVRLHNAQDIEKSKRIKYKTLVNTSLRVKGEIMKKMQEREKPTFSSGNV